MMHIIALHAVAAAARGKKFHLTMGEASSLLTFCIGWITGHLVHAKIAG